MTTNLQKTIFSKPGYVVFSFMGGSLKYELKIIPHKECNSSTAKEDRYIFQLMFDFMIL